MAQPFEQVLESLRGIATTKLGQLEERSKAYLTEIQATIEAKVERERTRTRTRTTAKGRAASRTTKKKANATSEEVSEDSDKENARKTRRSTRSTRSRTLAEAGNVVANEEAQQPTRSSRRLRSKKATATTTTTASGAAAPPAAGTGRVTRSRARQQTQVLETILETTENEDTSPEPSPEAGEKLVEELVVAKEEAPEAPKDLVEEKKKKTSKKPASQKAKKQGAGKKKAKKLEDAVAQQQEEAPVPVEETARRRSTRKRTSLEEAPAAVEPKASEAEKIPKEEDEALETGIGAEEAAVVAEADPDKTTTEAAEKEEAATEKAGKKRGRARVAKGAGADSSAEEVQKEPRKLRRRTRSSRMIEETTKPAVEEEPEAVVEAAAPVVEEDEALAVAAASPVQAVEEEVIESEAVGPLLSPAVSTPQEKEDSQSCEEERELKEPEEAEIPDAAEEGSSSKSKVKAIASQLEGKIKENKGVRISEVLQVEAAATKKAVQDAKVGGLKNMMSLLSPENEDGQGERTMSRFEHVTQGASQQSGSKNPPGLLEKASNVITSVTSFLPAVKKDAALAQKARKPVEVKALKAAEAARKQEALKLEEKMRRKEVMRDRAVAVKEAKQKLEEQKRRQMLLDQQRKQDQMKKRGEEIARKKRERDEEAKREKEEKRRKLELELEKRKLAADARSQTAHTTGLGLGASDPKGQKSYGNEHKVQRPAPAMNAAKPKGVVPQSSRGPLSASNRMANHASGPAKTGLKPRANVPNAGANKPAPFANRTNASDLDAPAKTSVQKPFSFSAKVPSAVVQKTPELKMLQSRTQQTPVLNTQKPKEQGIQSYQMTPYRSDSEESDDEFRPAKPVPQWAKSKNLGKQLQAQMGSDPDEIFNAKQTTCSLDDVFKTDKPKPCFKRRGSSGNWNTDMLTWKEEWFYKKAMGYV
ncbi:hypothetical protein HOP50_03g24220 [Chloropicon primus]|uniref:Inner centromere protein ARK-binding domain-containing protein n=1 Tax=Chloropicon primus TaxID=1764295 RepID=A0A5B8MJP2_9CHLO|nr:hypothetical protein A3770_03p24230 [Chloropicon primus]UPQ99116.1 hypothetical protein HOP50_03g24220 [Chloropicon primus]|eukprot:QDZ19905.1 hypothetical protein A3770_03p24230 [Chloropicon primus]